MPLHALAQVEGVFLAVFGHGPALGQAGHNLGAAALEIDHAAVDLGVGIKRGAGGVDAGVEVLGAALGAEHQRLGRTGASGQQGGRATAHSKALLPQTLARGDFIRSLHEKNSMNKTFGRVRHTRGAPVLGFLLCRPLPGARLQVAGHQASCSSRCSGRWLRHCRWRAGSGWKTRSPGRIQRRGQFTCEHDALRGGPLPRHHPGVEPAGPGCKDAAAGKDGVLSPCSTVWPRYITSTSWAMWRTTPRSCEMNK
jgi:hypothetical protein